MDDEGHNPATSALSQVMVKHMGKRKAAQLMSLEAQMPRNPLGETSTHLRPQGSHDGLCLLVLSKHVKATVSRNKCMLHVRTTGPLKGWCQMKIHKGSVGYSIGAPFEGAYIVHSSMCDPPPWARRLRAGLRCRFDSCLQVCQLDRWFL